MKTINIYGNFILLFTSDFLYIIFYSQGTILCHIQAYFILKVKFLYLHKTVIIFNNSDTIFMIKPGSNSN